MLFTILKSIHLLCALLSISSFLLRGYWMMTESPLLQARPTRILPHVIDTLLLFSAIWMTTIIRQYPFVDGWLTAKLLTLVLYILLGTIALKRGRTKQGRLAALLGASALFFYILSVAYMHRPLPF